MELGVEVELSPNELRHAAMTGIERHIEAIRQGKPDRFGAKQDDGWTLHIEGAAGEMAVARAVGRYWEMSVNTFRAGGDIGGMIQVRTRRRSDYELIVREGDRDDDVFVLVTGHAPRYRVVGWIRGRDAKQSQWRHEHGGRPPAYFVPQQVLHPMPRQTGSEIHNGVHR